MIPVEAKLKLALLKERKIDLDIQIEECEVREKAARKSAESLIDRACALQAQINRLQATIEKAEKE